jgi:hypothetical protein
VIILKRRSRTADLASDRRGRRRSLRIARRLGRPATTTLFEFLTQSICAAHRGDFELAAVLIGVFDTLEAATPPSTLEWPPVEVQLRDDHVARVRAALGEKTYELARVRGANLTNDRAVDLALDRPGHR